MEIEGCYLHREDGNEISPLIYLVSFAEASMAKLLINGKIVKFGKKQNPKLTKNRLYFNTCIEK